MAAPDPSEIDHKRLTFGKYVGRTPNEVAELGEDGENYIRWMFENVRNKPTCSELLYRACGGYAQFSGTSAGMDKKAEVYSPNRAHDVSIKSHFDNYENDDDIPF